MSGAAIAGCGMDVPARVVANADLAAVLDTSDEWIRQRTGINERRVAAPGEATSDLAVRAGRRALRDAGMDAAELDLVVVATCTPDHQVPGTAPFVQERLGARHAGAFDVNAGCTGFLTALSVAAGLVAADTIRSALVCGAETLSGIVDHEDRSTAVLFGDGAGAVVVRATDGPARIGPFTLGADGARAAWLFVPAGGSRDPAGDERTLLMRGGDVYRHAVDRMTEAARTLMPGGPDDVDLFVAHQANVRILAAVAGRLGLRDEQVVCNIGAYGNTSAASIPIALAESSASGRLRDGMTALLAAFGAGFTWGAGLVRWGAA